MNHRPRCCMSIDPAPRYSSSFLSLLVFVTVLLSAQAGLSTHAFINPSHMKYHHGLTEVVVHAAALCNTHADIETDDQR